MKIFKKRTTFEIGAGVMVDQGAWTVITQTLVQSSFRVVYPQHLAHPDSLGALGVFLNEKVDHLRFISCPADAHDRHQEYEKEYVNFTDFSGKFAADDHAAFSHRLALVPTFDVYEGWRFEFANAISQMRAEPSEYDAEVDAEKIIADIVCSNSFKVSFGRRYLPPSSALYSIAGVVLQDIEGLRLAITDVLGIDYLKRLLRKNGYEIDIDSLTRRYR